MTTPLINIPEIIVGQSQKEVTHNEALLYIDVIIKNPIIGEDTVTPPASPVVGDTYTVGVSATGVWTGQDGKIASFINSTWVFLTPIDGWTWYSTVSNDFLRYDSATTSWIANGGSFELALGNPALDGYILSSTAAGVRSWIPAPAGGGGGVSYALIEGQFPSGTNGGASTGGVNNLKPLNTIVSDIGGIVNSLAANQFTLIAGTYIIEIDSKVWSANKHQCFLSDTTNAVNYDGTSGTCLFGTTNLTDSSTVKAVVVSSGVEVYEVRHYTGVGHAVGLGANTNKGAGNEVYTSVGITKIA